MGTDVSPSRAGVVWAPRWSTFGVVPAFSPAASKAGAPLMNRRPALAGFRSAGVIKHFSRILSRLSTLIKNTRVQKIVLHKRGTSYPTIGKKRLRKRHANRTTEEELGNQQRQAGGAV